MEEGDNIDLLELKNDYTFKRVFGFNGNEQITKGLLNSILDNKVTDINLDCNKILERDLYNDKLGILDIRAKINKNIDCDIEMQVIDSENIEKRILYYVAKMYTNTIKKSDNYLKLNKCIGIVFTDFELDKLKEIPEYITQWNLRAKKYDEIILTDDIEIYIIEMPKASKYANNSKLDTWINFILDSEGVDMSKVDEDVKQAKKVLEDISKDEHEQYLADLRYKYICEMNTLRTEGLERGKKQGIEEGKIQGIKEGKIQGIEEGKRQGIKEGKKLEKIEIAKKMKFQKMDIKTIIEFTGLTEEEINKL